MYSFSLQLKDLFSSPMERIRASLRSVNSEVDDLDRNIDQMSTNSGSKLNGLAGMAVKFLGAFATIEAAKNLFKIGVEAEQTKIKFEVLLGSAEKGKALLDQLNAYANFTPYSNGGIAKAAETMLGFGITQDKILPNMKMLGDVAMGNEEKMGSLSLVYSQIMATGRLMGQDLLQLINTGFNPLQVISEKTGLSMGVLKEKMEKGAISADMVSAAFNIATSEGGRYYGMAERMAQSAGGRWSTFLGTLQENVKKIGERFATSLIPVIDFAEKGMGAAVVYGRQFLSIAKPIVRFMIDYRAVIYTAVVAIGVFNGILAIAAARTAYLAWSVSWSTSAIIFNTISTYGLSGAWTVLNAVMRANPIGVIITILALLVAGVVYAWRNFDWFRGGVIAVWEVLKGLGTMIKDYVITRINELMNAITGVYKAMMALKNGDFSKALDIGKGVGKDLLGVDSKANFLKSGQKLGEIAQQGYAKGISSSAPAGVKSAGAKKPGAITDPNAFNSLLGGGGADGKAGKGKGNKGLSKVASKADGIIGGGSKQTNINITIGKLQDQTVIHVDSAEKGLNNLGDKVQEILLRAVNSVNQMQTT